MDYKKLQVFSFLVLLAIVAALVLGVLWPFINILAMAAILSILFRPVYNKLLARLRSRNGAAALTLLLMIVIVVVPLLFIGKLLFNELVHFYQEVRSGEVILDPSGIVSRLPAPLQESVRELSSDINSIVSRLTGSAFTTLSDVVSNIAGFFLSLFLVFFATYYLLRDGHSIKKALTDLSPMATSQENILFEKLIHAVRGVAGGTFLIALLQGMIATVGYLLFGVPQPFLWGMLTVIAALVPTVGTSLALIPAVAYLVVTGQNGPAIGLAIWGALAVGLVDNVVSPKLIGSRIQLHPLLVLLSVIGGIQFFGFLGFLLGPILLAIFIALIDMYRHDFKQYVAR
jgi:predicted PurR-regulated permease PerM